ncbi:hypothetical protein B0H14DRAFT_2639446 [Mycena olivaceomarginata]|nr:hypothetical protein B0H14DRAFT_2639446 [Mycena olivaceomarginata]
MNSLSKSLSSSLSSTGLTGVCHLTPTLEQGGKTWQTPMMHDLGTPIVCTNYDLEEALLQENTMHMAHEDAGLLSDDNDDPELEDTTPLTASHSTLPSMNKQPTPPSTMPLGGLAKRKQISDTSSTINTKQPLLVLCRAPCPQPLLLEFWRRLLRLNPFTLISLPMTFAPLSHSVGDPRATTWRERIVAWSVLLKLRVQVIC